MTIAAPISRYSEAITHRWNDRFQEAEGILTELNTERPKDALVWNALGSLHEDFGRFEQCLYCYQQAERFDLNEDPQITTNLAYALMRMERYEEAWPRWERGRFNRAWKLPPDYTRWRGENAPVLVLSEGGFGDTFLYRRFLRGMPADSILWVWDKLEESFNLWPEGIVVPHRQVIAPRLLPYATSIMSLFAVGPARLKTIDDIPPDSFGRHPQPLPSPAKFGLCWAAGEKGVQRVNRSIPVEYLEPLRQFDWVSLNPHHAGPDWVKRVELPTWQDTYRLISRLDLVVTVDTAVAHLAALAGVPTMILVPSRSDWKWSLPGSQIANKWYGPFAHVIRNGDPVDWSGAIQECMGRISV